MRDRTSPPVAALAAVLALACSPSASSAGAPPQPAPPAAPAASGSVPAGPARTPEAVARCREEELARLTHATRRPIVPPTTAIRLRAAGGRLGPDDCAKAAREWNFYSRAHPEGCFVNAFTEVTELTLVDGATGLMWQREAPEETFTLEAARRHVAAMNAGRFAGHTDWRLPTAEELLSVMEVAGDKTRLDPDLFCEQNELWTADALGKHALLFDALLADCTPVRATDAYHVLAVRTAR